MTRLNRRKFLCFVSVTLSTVVLSCFIYERLRSKELTKVAQGYNHSDDRLQLSKTILIKNDLEFWEQLGNPEENNEDVLYINEETEKNFWKKRLPSALVIGIRKGGTRAILDFLGRHPSVRACPREVHFFDRQETYSLGLDWYREQMPLSLQNQTTIEKTPAYFVTEGVPNRVFNMSPFVKLLVVVRDPTIRAISDYAQLFDKSNSAFKSFENYITKDPQHRSLRETSPVVTTGIYVDHLSKWLKYFPREQIHFISGEELVKNPVNEIQPVEKFLGLKPFIDENLFYYNETKGFLCLAPAAHNGKGDRSGCLSQSKGRPHPAVDENIVALLRDFYRPLNEEFYRAVGRNFGWP